MLVSIILTFFIILIFIGVAILVFYSMKNKQSESKTEPKKESESEKVVKKYGSSSIEKFEETQSSESRNQETQIAIESLLNDIINLVPDKYKESFRKCRTSSDFGRVMSQNSICFLKDYINDPNYQRDIHGAIVILITLLMGVIRTGSTLNDVKNIFSYNEITKTLIVNGSSGALGGARNKEQYKQPDGNYILSLDQYVDLVIESISSDNIPCQYCL